MVVVVVRIGTKNACHGDGTVRDFFYGAEIVSGLGIIRGERVKTSSSTSSAATKTVGYCIGNITSAT
jgi:hypothetical protein